MGDSFNVVSLCAGYEGAGLGIKLAVPSTRVVCAVEIETYAMAVLVARMEAGDLDPCPIWSDLRTFDGRAWRGVVDCVSAGYPCQPFSFAGRRAGSRDPRHLWPYVRRAINQMRPPYVFLENVAGHLSLGFGTVARQLERLGYRVEAYAAIVAKPALVANKELTENDGVAEVLAFLFDDYDDHNVRWLGTGSRYAEWVRHRTQQLMRGEAAMIEAGTEFIEHHECDAVEVPTWRVAFRIGYPWPSEDYVLAIRKEKGLDA